MDCPLASTNVFAKSSFLCAGILTVGAHPKVKRRPRFQWFSRLVIPRTSIYCLEVLSLVPEFLLLAFHPTLAFEVLLDESTQLYADVSALSLRTVGITPPAESLYVWPLRMPCIFGRLSTFPV